MNSIRWKNAQRCIREIAASGSLIESRCMIVGFATDHLEREGEPYHGSHEESPVPLSRHYTCECPRRLDIRAGFTSSHRPSDAPDRASPRPTGKLATLRHMSVARLKSRIIRDTGYRREAAPMVDHERNASAPTGQDAHPAIPTPAVGAGSRELPIDADDPEVLRQALIRAKDRLSFYEGFDRIIGENIRRSGELMLETIALREEAQERERRAAEEAAARATAAEQDRHARIALLDELLAEASQARTTLDALHAKLQTARTALDPIAEATPAETSVSEPVADETVAASLAEDVAPAETVPTDASPATVETPAAPEPEPVLEEVPVAAAPVAVDVLIHNIPRASTAVSLQQFLSEQSQVQEVETREFAEGILRLVVTTTDADAIPTTDFSAWSTAHTVRVITSQPNAIELTLD